MLIFVQALTGLTVALEVEPTISIFNIKQRLQHRQGIPTDQMRLIHARRHLEDSRTLLDYQIVSESIITLVLRLGGHPDPSVVYWSRNIVRHTVDPTTKVLRTRPSFVIDFQSNLDLNFLSRSRNLSEMKNMWRNYWSGPDYHFTDLEIREWFAVIELSPEFASTPLSELQTQIDTVRYFLDGINHSYYGGQVDSWQRFTATLPVKITTEIDARDNQVIITVCETLKPNTRYALICLNNWDERRWYEDYVLPFTTEGVPRLPMTGTAVAVKRNEFTIQDQISFGSFSTVFRAIWREIPVALKVYTTFYSALINLRSGSDNPLIT